LIASIAGIIFASVQLWMSAYVVFRTRGESDGAIILHLPSDAKAAVRILAIYLGYFALVYLAGFVYATALFVIFYLMRFSQLGSIRSTILGVVCSAAIYFGFQRLLKLPLPDGLSIEPVITWVESFLL
jgi:Tripartite tricarboxylate transporter TctB family